MNIGIIVRDYTKNGGPSNVMRALSEELAEKYEIHVYSNTVPDNKRPSKIIFHKVQSPKLGKFTIFFSDIASYLKSRNKHDFIMSPSYMALNPNIMRMQSCYTYALKQWKKHIHKIPKGERKFPGIEDEINAMIERFNFKSKRLKLVICPSSKIKDEVIQTFDIDENKIIVIPNGVYLKKVSAKKEDKNLKKKYKIPKEDKIIITVGDHFFGKGTYTLIKSLKFLKNKNTTLIIVGRGNPKDLNKIISSSTWKSKIILIDNCNDPSELYAISDLFVLPTIYEAFGLVITEAMVSGIPVITSKIAGAAENFQDEKDIILINNPLDEKEIAEKIERLLNDKKLCNKLKINASKKVKTLSWPKMAKKYFKALRKISAMEEDG